MGKKTHSHSFSNMSCQDHKNNLVSTETMVETTTEIPKPVSPTGDESPLCHLLPFLPYELIYNILIKVPLRSLVEFKCVCKSWKALISDPQFAKDHLFISTSDSNMTHQRLVYDIRNPHGIVSFSVQSLFQNPSNPAKPRSFRMSHHEYRILGSCNGLLCLYRYKQCYLRLKLWNPCTGLKSKGLSIRYRFNTDGFGIFNFHGLGYDYVNHRYKVIAGVPEWPEIGSFGSNYSKWPKIETKIYSFGLNSCTVIQNQNFRQCIDEQGKFVRGTLNWIVKRRKSDDQWVILSLDIVTEIFGEVFLPEVDEDGDKICDPVLGVSRNCLCVCFFDSNGTNAHWIVMLMKEYGVRNSWIKLVMTPHIGLIERYRLVLEPLFISENGVVLLRTTMRNDLFLYNSNNGRLFFPRIGGKVEVQFNMHIYLESLVSPNC